MARLFNSTFENSLRVILLLDAFSSPQTVDMLYAADFMTVYGKTFDLSSADLNGDNKYKFSEFASRRSVVQSALKSLVLDGLANAAQAEKGIVYSISKDGKKYADSLDSVYAKQYRATAARVAAIVKGKSERAVISAINKMSAESIRKDATQ